MRVVWAARHRSVLLHAARLCRLLIAAFGTIAALAAFNAVPQATAAGLLSPSSGFVQAGAAEEAQMLVVGATWDWDWHHDLRIGRVSGYWEASFGRWNSDRSLEGGSAWVTQVGVTPVLRLFPGGSAGRWFVEAGIGANFLMPIYQNETKRFSTTFNFGDHLAIGRRFGDDGGHEIALRIQHFSNAGIREPNPGENFLQIRYSRRFGGPSGR